MAAAALQARPVTWIVIAQLFGTSLWFSANSAADDLRRLWGLSTADIGWLTNAVQAGFIAGTLGLALSGLADRFAASRIFVVCALLGATSNAGFALLSQGLAGAMAFRFAVGLALAGIYPLGMKLVVSWDPLRAGQSLGLLVGMLTLGTALPHGIRALGASVSWQWVMLSSSCLALLAAVLVGLLGDGPHVKPRDIGSLPGGAQVLQAFPVPAFRASAFGYFGHMWELYTFWTLVPLLLVPVLTHGAAVAPATVSAWAFSVIGIGALGSIAGGMLSRHVGSARVAWVALGTSGLMCALYPMLDHAPAALVLALLLLWGIAVIADSPQFSAMSVQACPPQLLGSALTIQNCLGFALTTVSIPIATGSFPALGSHVAWIMLPGPIFGLIGMRRLRRQRQDHVKA
jgi:MFS family permease